MHLIPLPGDFEEEFDSTDSTEDASATGHAETVDGGGGVEPVVLTQPPDSSLPESLCGRVNGQ